MRKNFQFLDGADIHDMAYLDPKLLIVFAQLVLFCRDEKIPLRLTSTVRPYDNISKSDTHQTGRAIDVRTIGLKEEEIEKMISFLDRYDRTHNIGAISSQTGKSRLAYYHYAQGVHLHLQVRRK